MCRWVGRKLKSIHYSIGLLPLYTEDVECLAALEGSLDVKAWYSFASCCLALSRSQHDLIHRDVWGIESSQDCLMVVYEERRRHE